MHPKSHPLHIDDRLDLLAELGQYLQTTPDESLQEVIRKSYLDNRWFTEANTRNALQSIAGAFLDRERLREWSGAYPVATAPHPEKTIGLVMAGNIPLVGFHDWLCVFVSGHRAKVRLSEKDKHLLPFLVKILGDWTFESWEYTEFLSENDLLKGFDAVIATGSNNTARYFEQYFGKYPHIIRRNRNGVGVLDGSETVADLLALGRDVFTYFGLGCRNVSKLYVPRGYDFTPLLETFQEFSDIIHHDKYKNNFDYNLTLIILNQMPYQNNGCLLLREDPALEARIASVHYEVYDSPEHLETLLENQRSGIQCLVGHRPIPGWTVLPFGKTQEPGLFDYPDGVDVMHFLTNL